MKGTIGEDHRLDVGEHEDWRIPSLILHGLDKAAMISQVRILFLAVWAFAVPTGVGFLRVETDKAGSAGVNGLAPPIGLVLVEASGPVKHPMTTFAEKVGSQTPLSWRGGVRVYRWVETPGRGERLHCC